MFLALAGLVAFGWARIEPMLKRSAPLATAVVGLSEQWNVPAAHVAFAYAFQHPNLASIVFGARSAEQLRENVDAFTTFELLNDGQRAVVRELGKAAG